MNFNFAFSFFAICIIMMVWGGCVNLLNPLQTTNYQSYLCVIPPGSSTARWVATVHLHEGTQTENRPVGITGVTNAHLAAKLSRIYYLNGYGITFNVIVKRSNIKFPIAYFRKGCILHSNIWKQRGNNRRI